MNIGIYIYQHAEVLDFSGPFEVFSTAKRVGRKNWNIGNVDDGYLELSVLPCRHDLKNRGRNDWQNGRSVDTRALPLSLSRRNANNSK